MSWNKFKITISPLSIVVFYACVGGIWLLVVFTRVVDLFFHDKTAKMALEINTSVFILVTAGLLYLLIRKSESGIKKRKSVAYQAEPLPHGLQSLPPGPHQGR